MIRLHDKCLSFFAIIASYIIGFGLLRYSIDSANKSVEASNWSSVTGTITNLSLEESSVSHDGTTYEVYEVKVEYRYSVMDRTYTSSRLAFGYASTGRRQVHQDILNKLESASSVKVRYNPQDPETSTLSFGIHNSIKLRFIGAIIWLALTFNFTFFSFETHGPIRPILFSVIICLFSAIIWLVIIFSFTLIFWIAYQPDSVLLNNMEVTRK